MNPGTLDRRITFVNAVITTNIEGDTIVTWVPVLVLTNGQTWGKFRSNKGDRSIQASEFVITYDGTFTIRFRNDFTPVKSMRILYEDKYFSIHSVVDVEDRRRFYDIKVSVTDENSN